MFIDIHVHPAFYDPINGDEAVEEMRHSALDIHKNGTAPLEHIFNQMRCAGLDRLCLLPEDYTTELGRPVVTNEEVKALVDLAPDKFIGFASVDPFLPDAAEKLEHAFGDLGLKGLKLHPSRQHFYPCDERLNAVYDVCETYKKPIIFHSGLSWEPNTLTKYSRPTEFEELAATRPNLKICLAHFGWPWVQETAMLMIKYPNVYTDTAMMYMDSAEQFMEKVFHQDMGEYWLDHNFPDQVMFGSNAPRFRPVRIKRGLDSLKMREDTRRKVMGENALRFLGMEGK